MNVETQQIRMRRFILSLCKMMQQRGMYRIAIVEFWNIKHGHFHICHRTCHLVKTSECGIELNFHISYTFIMVYYTCISKAAQHWALNSIEFQQIYTRLSITEWRVKGKNLYLLATKMNILRHIMLIWPVSWHNTCF